MMTMARRRHCEQLLPAGTDSDASPGRAADLCAERRGIRRRTGDYLAAGGDFITAGHGRLRDAEGRSVDIDSELDLKLADFLLSQGQR